MGGADGAVNNFHILPSIFIEPMILPNIWGLMAGCLVIFQTLSKDQLIVKAYLNFFFS